jgi:hypothetical protein
MRAGNAAMNARKYGTTIVMIAIVTAAALRRTMVPTARVSTAVTAISAAVPAWSGRLRSQHDHV